MDVYLAGSVSHYYFDVVNKFKEDENLESLLVGKKATSIVTREMIGPLLDKKVTYPFYALSSFLEFDYTSIVDLNRFDGFMLDSGAFTFMSKGSFNKNIDKYIEEYAHFITNNKVKHFFELDIDSFIGYENVKKYRKKLENLVGYQCIPVWHKNRGVSEFRNLCREYNYVAIGGIVSKEITKSQFPLFSQLIYIAHENDCKIHGLGFTSLTNLQKYHFDSVDSSSWVAGSKFGFAQRFTGNSIVQYTVDENKQMINSNLIRFNDYIEWRKFQKYAKENL